MKKITQIALLFAAIASTAQEKMISHNGIISFEASIPLFEEVEAINPKTTCVFFPKTGQITCWINIKDFKFKRILMEEHFNKNYMESSRFPKAIFRGKIQKFDFNNVNAFIEEHQINGKLTIHGITKKIILTATLKKANQGIELNATFPVNTDAFKIEIPSIVRSKISKKVKTKIICILY